MNKTPTVSAIIVAAGESRRMNGIDKVLALLEGQPVILRSARPFQDCPLVRQIVLVVNAGNRKTCREIATGKDWSKVSGVCLGGRRRQDSVLAGLKEIKDSEWVIIHDGARPLVTIDLITTGLEAAKETGAAVAAVPVTDTIKQVDRDEIVIQTLPRQNLRAIQTPQVFRTDILLKAYQQAHGDVTDDAMIVEQAGYKVKLYMGSYENIKITR